MKSVENVFNYIPTPSQRWKTGKKSSNHSAAIPSNCNLAKIACLLIAGQLSLLLIQILHYPQDLIATRRSLQDLFLPDTLQSTFIKYLQDVLIKMWFIFIPQYKKIPVQPLRNRLYKKLYMTSIFCVMWTHTSTDDIIGNVFALYYSYILEDHKDGSIYFFS